MKRLSFFHVPCIGLLLLAGCRNGGSNNDGTCDPAAPECGEGLVCEASTDGISRCIAPVTIVGIVLALADDAPIAGAIVQAADINGAAIGTTGVSVEDGSYVLTVPATRDENGTPIDGVFTLRVAAQGFQEFPTAIRPALPLEVSTATLGDVGWVLENSLTTVGLIALPGDISLLGLIVGSISAQDPAGILVVAEGAGDTLVGFSDSSGNYRIFNVPAGTYDVQGFAAGVQLDGTTAGVPTGEEVSGVDLTEVASTLNTLSGSVQIVNAPGGSLTSVIMALESTFDDAAGRGKVPPGLRVAEIDGAFIIEGIPDGNYVVLAAFENDDLVRDPDTSISGTDVVRVTLPDPDQGATLTISDGFKVTEALAVVSPGASDPEQVDTTTPTLTWDDDSSEDGYEVRVFDAFGTEVWSTEVGSVSGSPTVSVDYAGPALESGMFYQFRVTSFREKTGTRTPISTTEDLEGVFFYIAP